MLRPLFPPWMEVQILKYCNKNGITMEEFVYETVCDRISNEEPFMYEVPNEEGV
jgi:hypothetical protein